MCLHILYIIVIYYYSQMPPSAFAAAIAEYNDHNGSFDDE